MGKRIIVTYWKRMIASLLVAALVFTSCEWPMQANAQEVNQTEKTEDSTEDAAEGAAASEENDATEEIENSSEETAEPIGELEDLRDEMSKQFLMDDGTIAAVQYDTDVHYQDEEGNWQEIDNSLTSEEAEDSDDASGYSNKEGKVKYKFAKNANANFIVRIVQGKYHIFFSAKNKQKQAAGAKVLEMDAESSESVETVADNGSESTEEGEESDEQESTTTVTEEESENTESVENGTEKTDGTTQEETTSDAETDAQAEVINDTETTQNEDDSLAKKLEVENNRSGVVYENLFAGTDVEYLLSGSSLKENIVVKEKQDTYEYVFEIKTNHITIQEEDDGSIAFYKEDTGEKLYSIPKMYMWDAEGHESNAIDISITTKNKKSTLTIKADEEWINSEERVFPVTIDPTLQSTSYSVDDEARIVKNQYVCSGDKTLSSAGYGRGFLGYDSSGEKNYRLFVQFKKLPTIPENSVIVDSEFYYYMEKYSQKGTMSSITIGAKEVTESWTWGTKINWNTQPAFDSRILDYQVLSDSRKGEYVSWDITRLIKNHYEYKDNTSNTTSSFVLTSVDESVYTSTYAGKASVVQENSVGFGTGAQPVVVIAYRDTRGLEDYYTYQTIDLGKAGTGYISDYAKTVTVVRPIFQTTSTTVPFQLNLVYNSAIGDKLFGSDAGLCTKDFSNMQLGLGWKMSVQETIIEKTISSKNYLIWSDSDGTDHYFLLDSGSTYKDEDGLKLTIVKESSSSLKKYTMTDEQGNKKIFHNGFLSSIIDANGNAIHLLYNGASYSASGTWYANTSATNQLTKIVRLNSGQSTPKEIATFTYDSRKFLQKITDFAGRTYTLEYTDATDVDSSVDERNMTNITDPDGTYARYEYYTITSHKVSKIARTCDSETMLGGRFRFNITKQSAKSNSFGEIVWTSDTVYKEERRVDITNTDPQQVYYCDWGMDATAGTDDDIWTYCTFDNAGRTINQVSMNSAGDEIYGATSNAYSSGSGKSANKVLSDVEIGVGGANLIRNSGIEIVTDGVPRGWSDEKKVSTDTESKVSFLYDGATNVRSGFYSAQVTIDTAAKANASGELGGAFLSTEALESGKTYTFSGYFKNTDKANFNDKSQAYLQVRNSSGTVIATSSVINQCTSANIEDGWSRLILTFTAPSADTYTLAGCVDWIYGVSTFDDFQLEKGTGASSYNYFSNGDAEDYDGWGKSTGATRVSGGLMNGEYCLKIVGSTADQRYAFDYVYLNTSSDNTFVLSGWAKGAAAANLSTTDSSARAYGLEAELIYEDDSTEKHYVSFDGDTTHLQYVSMNVVPKKSGTIIKKAAVRYIYSKSVNTVYFDCISFRKEPISCYKYDSDGNVTAVTATDNDTMNFKYSAGNLIQNKSDGNGVYDYSYDDKHNLTKVTNDGVDMNLTYDSMGHVKTTKLENTSEINGRTISTLAKYTDDGDYLKSQTDALGNTTTYETNESGMTTKVTDALNQETRYCYNENTNRLEEVFLQDETGVKYTYLEGVLTTILRTSLLPEGTKETQNYSFTYDTYDNVTSIKVGDRTLASYEYMAKNGPLAKITYGNGFYIEYEYDVLGRVVAEKENGVLKYRYIYGAAGDLSRQEELNSSGTVIKAVCYEYDSLKRLIRSWEEELQNGVLVRVLSTEHLYDTSNRLVSQSWKSDTDERSESYTYNSDDGTLSSLTTASGEKLDYTYDYLKRLQSRTDGTRTITYNYQNVGDTGTSTQVSSITQSKVGSSDLTLSYEYDALQNIKKITKKGTTAAEYTYDNQSQLTKEKLPQSNLEYNYSYDTAGNIRSVAKTESGSTTTRTYTYGDASWKDLLTAIDGHAFTYDASGNPLKYYNGKDWTFTWTSGRKLNTAVSGSTIVSYQYGADDLRLSKTVNNVTHNYLYLGDQLVEETGSVK